MYHWFGENTFYNTYKLCLFHTKYDVNFATKKLDPFLHSCDIHYTCEHHKYESEIIFNDKHGLFMKYSHKTRNNLPEVLKVLYYLCPGVCGLVWVVPSASHLPNLQIHPLAHTHTYAPTHTHTSFPFLPPYFSATAWLQIYSLINLVQV